ncbi:MAG: hypothetical protein J0H07_18860 [Sphingobacteriales bacterium]|nr:hypothetical protein [Sphingobacteriales bacterium]
MGLNVKIDLKNVYRIVAKDPGQQASEFDSILTNTECVRLGIRISHTSHPLIPNTYNLAFGPIRKNGAVDDKVRLSHKDYSKVFSTALLDAISFLEEHPGSYVGIDGSDNARAYMYYRCIQNNFTYLSSIFTIIGVNYYIRMLRQEEDGNCDLDTDDMHTKYKEIEANEIINPEKLYNYFIFNIKPL